MKLERVVKAAREAMAGDYTWNAVGNALDALEPKDTEDAQ